MGMLLIEILIVMLFSSIAFVFGAILGSSARRNDKEEELLKEKDQPVLYQLSKHQL